MSALRSLVSLLSGLKTDQVAHRTPRPNVWSWGPSSVSSQSRSRASGILHRNTRARAEGGGRGAVFSRAERTLPAEHPSPAPTLGRRFPTRALAVKKAGPDRRRKTERAEAPGLSRTRREGMSSSGNVPCLPSARRRPIRVATGARGQLWPAHSAPDAVFGSRFAKARQRAKFSESSHWRVSGVPRSQCAEFILSR